MTGQQVEVQLTDELPAGGTVTPEYPIDLIGVQLQLQPPPDTRVAGTVEVTSVAVADAAGGSTALDLVPSRDGWSWLLERGLNPPEAAPSAGDPDVIAFSEERPIYGDDGPLELRMVPDSLAEVAGRALPIAVSRSFADATQAEVGDPVAIGTLTRRTRWRSRPSSTHSRPSSRIGPSQCSTSAATPCPPTRATARTCSPMSGGCR